MDSKSILHSVSVCPECQGVAKRNFSNRKAMLFVRWKQVFRNRCAGTGCKTLIGAVVKSYGIERMRKGRERAVSCVP